MRVDEETRHDVYKGFEEVLGPKRAAAVIAMLLNIDWDQFATRADLEILEQRLRGHTKWTVGIVGTLIVAMIGSTAALVQAILSRVPVLPAG